MTSQTVSDHASNVDTAELAKFDRLASRWWDPDGESRPLHALNPVRLEFVRTRAALRGARVADIGCGGGLLSEALAGEGADVVGIDMAEQVIEVARLHLLESGRHVDYRRMSAEALAEAEPGAFDVVTCMELIEHVPDPAALIDACARLLKPGGQLFVSTLNRTPLAFFAAIVGAEYVFRLLPRGTHQYARFLRPSELRRMVEASGLALRDIAGLGYSPIGNTAWLTPRVDVNYVLSAVKPA